ncbi:Late embryogenesis abundant (LEA) protein-like protein [Thalictrum thalictroides]|uniref:Late embryogenesis abundant (LEA) protein-like protein n=1 Tax=Thalictrum thalictroides TaxID=46969 RepID=A0A7J6VEW4_THATH|nr:Late embryogenesis abundant (LEA) protein-like protein [Thalictrum thalictroides]
MSMEAAFVMGEVKKAKDEPKFKPATGNGNANGNVRKPKCEGYGSICYDPRFVGGDGVMFYFHGAKEGDFAFVSDDKFQINAHFIRTRPAGRTHALIVRWDGMEIEIPTDGEAEWRTNGEGREVVVERPDNTNSVKLTVTGLLEVNVKEQFLDLFCEDVYANVAQERRKAVDYKHISSAVSKGKRYDFLSDFVPEKIRVEDALSERLPGI